MSTREQSNTATAAKRDHRQEVTDSIVKMLEEGVAPWQKPWESAGMPFNPTTEKVYRGGNAIHLMATGLSRGYEDPRWMTYKQAAENGWQVRKGEKGTSIEFWEVNDKAEEKAGEPSKGDNGESAKGSQRRLVHRVYTVFNANQLEGVPAYERPQPSAFEAVQSGERILANSGAKIAHDQRDRAFYNRSLDSIHLPPKDAFKDAPGFYGTALHELAHWTGHPSRLNRPTLTDSYRFGDLNYAKEELRAELASVFIAAEVGVPHDPANHAAYVGSWIKALKDDKNEIFRAAHDASKATDFVLGLEREVSKAEALEIGDPVSGNLLESESLAGGATAKAQEIREEVAVLQIDRERVTEESRVGAAGQQPENGGEQPQREDSQAVARFEADSGTVSVYHKSSGTDHHVPVEAAASGQPNGKERSASSQASREELSTSFAAARELVADKLGDTARTFAAQTQSGNYSGNIIGETDLHVVQRLSPHSAIAHMRHLLNLPPKVGDNVTISYANEKGAVKELQERGKTRELVR
jgi:antirestriction protein ArdC